MNIPRHEEILQYGILWISAEIKPPTCQYLWIQTKSGRIATGWHDGIWWTCDGFRILSSEDYPAWWAEIEYPEGVRS